MSSDAGLHPPPALYQPEANVTLSFIADKRSTDSCRPITLRLIIAYCLPNRNSRFLNVKQKSPWTL